MQSTDSGGGVCMLWNFSGPLAHHSSVKSSARGMNGLIGEAAGKQRFPAINARIGQIQRCLDAVTEKVLK
jgi:hypothetical protein